MTPEEFSPLAMYGNKEVFEKRLKQGYTEVAFGTGEWIDSQRIVGLFVFYHPKRVFRAIATLERPKFYFDGHTIHGTPFEAVYTKRGFEKHTTEFKITTGSKTQLARIVQNWI